VQRSGVAYFDVERDRDMKSSIKSLMMAIPLIVALAGGQAWAAEEGYKQKNITCNGDLKKIVGVPNGEAAQILFIVLSSSAATTVKVNFGSNRVLQVYLDANDTFQTSLAEIVGNSGAAIKVGCSGNADLSLTLYYNIS